MMSLRWSLATLLLSLTHTSFIHPSSLLFTHAVPTSPTVTRPKILFMTVGGPDDYDDYADNPAPTLPPPPPRIAPSKAPTLLPSPKLCEYNPCLENQEPCHHQSALTGCLCPGLSGEDKPPHPPQLQGLVPRDGKVEVQWCAPPSVVTGYRVIIGQNQGAALEFGGESRRGAVDLLEEGVEVCVEALNKAGHSATSESSCQRYELPDNSSHTLKMGVIGGGIALILLLSLAALILWRRKVCRKATEDQAEGLGNPSYSRDGTL